jgi:acyl-CoA synthetase (NDP forming)
MPAPDLKFLFQPRSVAIIGASKDETKSGGMFISSLLKDGYQGTIYPVNPRESEVMSLRCYPSITEVPGEIDLAVIAIPARNTPQAVAECAQKGVKFAIAHAAGFGELGNEGKRLEQEMVEIARSGGVRIVGPNCMGLFSPAARINTISAHSRITMEHGGVAFVGQSGWACENMVLLGTERGLKFKGVVSIGNQSDLTIEDFLEFFGDDPETKVICFYIEGLKQPARFFKLAEKVSPQKPIIAWKGGSSEAGARAALSHTGSLAGNYAIFEAASQQKGVIRAQGLEELLDLAAAFSAPFLPRGREVGLLIEAGGGAVASSDACARAGLRVSPLPEAIQQKLHDFLRDKIPPSPNMSNPVDLVWVPFLEASHIYSTSLEIMIEAVDACVTICYAFLEDQAFLSRLEEIRDRAQKPILVVPGHSNEQRRGMTVATQRGIPTYAMPENAIRALAAMVRRAEYLRSLGISP